MIDWNPLGIFAEDIEAAFSHDDSNILSSEGYCSADRFQEYCKTDRGKNDIQRIKSEIFSDLESDVEKTYNAPFVKCLGYKGADKVNSSKFSDSFHSKLYLGKNHDIPTKWKITLDRALQRQR